MRYEYSKKPDMCPRCSHTRIADVQYGLPHYSERIYTQIMSGQIVIGGATQPEDPPAWQCTKCTLNLFRHK